MGKVPAGRLGTVDDIAKAVMFLSSSDAGYITGQQLVVDGGVINSVIGNLPRPEAIDGVGAEAPGRGGRYGVRGAQ